MPEVRRRFDKDFREGAVRIVEETGKPLAVVAPELGVTRDSTSIATEGVTELPAS